MTLLLLFLAALAAGLAAALALLLHRLQRARTLQVAVRAQVEELHDEVGRLLDSLLALTAANRQLKAQVRALKFKFPDPEA